MKIFALAVAFVVFSSPLWTSLVLAFMPRRFLVGVASCLCGLQMLFALFAWWFFWGGGIGKEANLSPWWQASLVIAFAPIATTLLRLGRCVKDEKTL